MQVNYTCRFFRGYIPCHPHKSKGAHCDGCEDYRPIRKRILIIKLDSIGDVLRTTSILPGLREKYPDGQITWITKDEARPLFEENPYIDRIFDLTQADCVLKTDEFDVVINLDAAPLSSRLATMAKGKEKYGFGYDPMGFVYPLNSQANEWFLMGIFDDIKKANSKTYQSLMLKICQLEPLDYTIQYFLKPEEIEIAERFAKDSGISDKHPIIGLNTGAGNRWEKKKWTEDGYLELINLLSNAHPELAVVLYGGPGEAERNKRLKSRCRGAVIDTGCQHDIRSFAALLNLSSLIVTGDTMALNLALALGKKVVALVGPTSSAELELYNQGIKITGDIPCLSCYKNTCNKDPDCMDLISPEIVLNGIKQLLNRSEVETPDKVHNFDNFPTI